MAATPRGVFYEWILYSNTSLPSSILSAEDKLYLKKKRPQPKGRKITDNRISKLWAFLYQNLVK